MQEPHFLHMNGNEGLSNFNLIEFVLLLLYGIVDLFSFELPAWKVGNVEHCNRVNLEKNGMYIVLAK